MNNAVPSKFPPKLALKKPATPAKVSKRKTPKKGSGKR